MTRNASFDLQDTIPLHDIGRALGAGRMQSFPEGTVSWVCVYLLTPLLNAHCAQGILKSRRHRPDPIVLIEEGPRGSGAEDVTFVQRLIKSQRVLRSREEAT